MKFQLKDLKKLLYCIKQHNINEINVQSKEFQLTINKSKATESLSNIVTKQTINIDDNNIKETNKNNNTHKKLKDKTLSSNKISNYSTIISPMVGTFYRSPAPNEAPFIELYDIVQKKQTVCIIEAMKLMNEIEAEINGEIVEILVQDGDIVDCGQALMHIKPINN
uniref:Biotin carboxyl carrier protein of acetyl-CoA carboxylase n=1 Tax=Riquetophycus sp. TaxID=1897556 RepID=A0A1C9C7X9_9FLOR|nr:acetyl-CoA carboxylase biotin carboxyl carrier protein [Riquetophycus sp.]